MYRRHLPPLIALRAFDAVGRSGSLRAAAEALAVSPTVVSRHLANLEARLGVAILEPKGRSVALTEAGVRFHAEIAKAFDLIDAATEKLTAPRKTPLRLWCSPGIAVMRLLSLLPELEARLPAFSIHFHPTLASPDWKRGEADAEIFYAMADRPTRDGIMEIRLARPRVMPVAAPSLVGRLNRRAEEIELLYEAPWVHELSGDEWRSWMLAAGLRIDVRAEQRLDGGVRLWHAHLAIGAAELGQGVALANEFLVEEQLASGRLVEIGRTDVRLGVYGLALKTSEVETVAARALRAWLGEALRPMQKMHESAAN
jgi:DNA-binding transcriptional LysR family regulator